MIPKGWKQPLDVYDEELDKYVPVPPVWMGVQPATAKDIKALLDWQRVAGLNPSFNPASICGRDSENWGTGG